MEEAIIKRVMPHNIEAEQSVIGSMIMDREAVLVASELLTGEDFYQRQYGVVFDAMVDLFSRDEPVDLVTLQNELRSRDVPEEVSSMEFVREILERVPTSANVKYYANIVAEKSTLRKLIRLNDEINNLCYAGNRAVGKWCSIKRKRRFSIWCSAGTPETSCPSSRWF